MEVLKNYISLSLVSDNYSTYNFEDSDIAIEEIFDLESDDSEKIICCSILAEASFGTDEYGNHEDILNSYGSVSIVCDCNFNTDCSELEFSIEE